MRAGLREGGVRGEEIRSVSEQQGRDVEVSHMQALKQNTPPIDQLINLLETPANPLTHEGAICRGELGVGGRSMFLDIGLIQFFEGSPWRVVLEARVVKCGDEAGPVSRLC